MNKRNYLIVLLFTVSNFVSGQEIIWPLQKCFDIALENSLDVKMKQLEISKAQKEYYNPLLNLLPSISLVGSHSYDFGSTIDPSTNGRVSSDIQYDNFYLNADISILDFNMLATAKKNKIAIEKSKISKAVVAYEYKMQLLEIYFEALYTQELVKIQKEQLINTKYNQERIEKEVILGKKPKSDLYDIQLSYSQEEKRILETEQLFELQKIQLFQLMNITDESIVNVVFQPYFLNENFEEIELFQNQNLINNPTIRLAELAYKSSLKDIAIQQASKLPSISAYYTLSSFYYNPLNQPDAAVTNFKTQIDNNQSQQIGFQLRVPVFNGFKNNKKIASTKIESERIKLVAEQEKIKIRKQLEQEIAKKKQYLQLKENLNTNLILAEKSFKTTQAKFIHDKVNAFEYTSVKNQLLSAEYNILKNDLLLQYTSLKINLLKNNTL